MSNNTLRVSFFLFFDENETEVDEQGLNEQELDAFLSSHTETTSIDDRYPGGVILRDDNNCIFRIEDELAALVARLCFEAIPSLASGEDYVYECWSYEGYIHFNQKNNKILIFSDTAGVDDLRVEVPREEFTDHLLKCGERFIMFLRKLQDYENDMTRKEQRNIILALLEQYRDSIAL